MKSYPSIRKQINTELEFVAFDKLDGSNIRAEWSPKKGFYKFGTRKRLLDPNEFLGKAIPIFMKKYGDKMPKVFAKQRWHHNVVCFFEFLGPHSFAGQHSRKDEHDVVLFDVSVHKKGLLSPKELIQTFEDFELPKVLHKGKIGKEFVDAVKNSELEGMTFEGVVCKAPHPRKKNAGTPVMFKIKSQAWLDKLKEHCGSDQKKYEALA